MNDEEDVGMLGSLEVPSTNRLLIRLSGLVMAISTLFSWLVGGPDSFPNIAGVGQSTFGVGLAVFLVGLLLLLKRMSVGVTLGAALGALGVTLIFVSLMRPHDVEFGVGVWIGMGASAAAVLGALLLAFESDDDPLLESQPMPVALGAALAVVASFWLDWSSLAYFNVHTGFYDSGPLNGLEDDVLFGYPVLIMGVIALVVAVELMTNPPVISEKRHQILLLAAQAASVTVIVTAGSNVLAMSVLGYTGVFSTGPIVALVGGVMLTRSIRQASNH